MQNRWKTHRSNTTLSAAFGNVKGGIVMRSGYCFRMFLPGKDGAPIPENDTGGAKGAAIDPAWAETVWCCYAWPATAGESGQRVFFINHTGDVLAAANGNGLYSGREAAPDANAACVDAGWLAASAAANRDGLDKQLWQIIQ